MPSKSKTPSKTSVGAQKRGAEAIQAALAKMELGNSEAPEFYSVQKERGGGQFTIRNAAGREYRGVGGHGGGKARIKVGHIVLAAYSATPEQGLEILAMIDDRKQAAALVKQGFMAPTVVNAALGAGSVSTGGAPVEEEGYVFAEAEPVEGEEDVDVEAL
jgi:hypothetical protein